MSRPSILIILLALALSCGADDPMPRELKARLESVFSQDKEPTADEVRTALLRQLRVAPPLPQGSSTQRVPFPSRESIDALYGRHGHRLVWSETSGKLRPQASTVLDALRRAGEHGLHPGDYAIDRLDALEREVRERPAGEGAAQRLADLDLLLTAAFLRYASDLSTGRVHPDEVQEGWHTNPPELDVASALDGAITGGDFQKLLESLPPPHAGYARLREALVKLREVEAAGGWPQVTARDAATLRQRLGLPPGDRIDRAVTGAVRQFQKLHGLEPEGALNEATIKELDVPVAERIRQVELNLERWRWMPRNLGDPHVLVNIAGFDLELSAGGAAAWRTRVVTGEAFTRTPVFSDRIVALVVNPPWNVPESIAVNEYLPELKKNPRGFARHELRMLQGEGDDAKEIDPVSVDWERVDPDKFPYRFRQDPGGKNPLGRVKFDLTNAFHIYLHDTPAGGVFDRTGRDLSHGCIRVENALDLADRIASDAEREKVREALEQPEERRIELQAKVPVHIFYWTAWADEGGNLRFAPDIYGFDAPQRQAIERIAQVNNPASP